MSELQEQIDRIKKSVGTEFTYVLSDKRELPAIIAAFDPKIGFTCLATGVIDSSGYDHSHNLDKNGNLCLIGWSVEYFNDVEEMLDEIEDQYTNEILQTGRWKLKSRGGSPSCSF